MNTRTPTLTKRQDGYHRVLPYLGIFGVVLLTVYQIDIHHIESLQQWNHQIEWRLLVALLSIAFMVACAMTPLPAEAAVVANCLLFGPIVGAFISWFSAILGAYLAYRFGKQLRKKLDPVFINSKKWRQFDVWFIRWGNLGFLLARSIPLIPFFVLNIGSAFLPIKKSAYLLITGIAITPHIVFISLLSHHMTN